MKKFIFIFISTFIINCSFGKECNSNWTVSANGINIGNTIEKFKLDDSGNFSVSSDFTPYKAIEIFGVSKVKRFASGENNQLMYREEKIITNSEIISYSWKRFSKKIWQKSINNKLEEPLLINGTVIDSTMFPYLLLMNIVNKDEHDFNALGKGDPYPIQFEVINSNENIKLISSVDNGYIDLQNNIPLSFGAMQDFKNIKGKVLSWKCN